MKFFEEYKNFEIVREGRRFYFVRHKLSQRNVVSFVFNGCKYDAFFCHTAFNQCLLFEALRLLKHLNNGGEL